MLKKGFLYSFRLKHRILINHEPPNLPSEVMFVFICLICPAGGLMLENRNYRAELFRYNAFYTFWWLPLEKQVTIIGVFF